MEWDKVAEDGAEEEVQGQVANVYALNVDIKSLIKEACPAMR